MNNHKMFRQRKKYNIESRSFSLLYNSIATELTVCRYVIKKTSLKVLQLHNQSFLDDKYSFLQYLTNLYFSVCVCVCVLFEPNLFDNILELLDSTRTFGPHKQNNLLN